MSLRINDEAPNFTAETTQGTINFHDWIGNGWAVLFSHPKDFTPVCTTELGYMAGLKSEFDKRNCKILGLSVDPVTDHTRWAKDIEETSGTCVTYPMIGDPELKVATLYDMLPAGAGTTSQGRTAADNATVRSVFVIGPDKKIKAMLTYPMSTGRNFDEVLRILNSVQLTAKHQIATPVNWKPGDDVIIAPAVSNEEAQKRYPGGFRAPKPYLRYVPQPQGLIFPTSRPGRRSRPPPVLLRRTGKARAADVISGPIAETVGYRASVMSSEPAPHWPAAVQTRTQPNNSCPGSRAGRQHRHPATRCLAPRLCRRRAAPHHRMLPKAAKRNRPKAQICASGILPVSRMLVSF